MLVRYVFEWAAQRASSTAWLAPDGFPVSWAALAQAVVVTARRLSEEGRFDRRGTHAPPCVVTQLPNGWEAIVLALAIDFLGAIESPLDQRLSAAEVRRRAERLDARLIISSQSLARAPRWVPSPADASLLSGSLLSAGSLGRAATSRVPGASAGRLAAELAAATEECTVRSDPRRPRLVLWTSGSTGSPKGVVLGGGALEANARGKLGAAPQTAEDVRLTVLPLAHAYARTCDFGTWLLTGGTLSAVDGWAGLMAAAPRVRPTLLNCVPYVIDKLLAGTSGDSAAAREARLSRLRALGMERLRMLGCGGAAMESDRFAELTALGIHVIQGYGLTEAGPVVCSATPSDRAPGVVGRPIAETEIRLDASGQVLCRGPGLMLGYWGDSESTAARFDQGWLRTGDRGSIDAEGRLRVLGRIDNVIVLSTGRKISPEPLEQRLQKIPGVRHVVLRGCGAGLEAWVDAEPQASAERLQAAFAEELRDELPEHQVRRVTLLARPLSADRGELTIKGTVCRQRVLEGLPA
ncbi:AMP-binding protein [Candidatus Laterigemmans baculatus]|uniref:AMP-binding protein n=1 Tax=Candidatus Laterigemmans baculatus TaxID=2770505 RepID=UPI0013D98403|nr:AMP-binding protein [Candidatus Laterigemmans baculatus]